MGQTNARNHHKPIPHFICNISREANITEEMLPSKCRSVAMAL